MWTLKFSGKKDLFFFFKRPGGHVIYRRNERGAWNANFSPQPFHTAPQTGWLLTPLPLPLPQSLYGQRSVVRWRHNKLSRLDRLPNFFNHWAPLKTPHRYMHVCILEKTKNKQTKQKNRAWNFLCKFFLRLNLHGIDGGAGSIDFDGLDLNNILSNQPHELTFRMTPLTITKNNILYIHSFPHILNACLIAIVFGTYFKYFWPCNFKKLYLCCYLQFHRAIYTSLERAKIKLSEKNISVSGNP